MVVDSWEYFFKRALRVLIVSLLLVLGGCAGSRPDIAIPKVPPSPPEMKSPPNVAVVLGGGGARGYAHVGVLLELERAHVPVDLIVGTSAGSVMGAIYADSGSVDGLQKAVMSATIWDYADIAVFPASGGVVPGYQLEKFLLQHMSARTFAELKLHFVAVTTDLTTGDTYIIQSGPVAPAVLASAAVPGIVKPVHLYGHTLVDGGVTDNVAIDVARRFHPKMIIAVDVGSELGYEIPNSSFGVLARSYDITLERLTKLQLKDADIVIHPVVGDIGMFDLSRKYDLVHAGQLAAYNMLPTIKSEMKEKGISEK
jgi:NTE family protein